MVRLEAIQVARKGAGDEEAEARTLSSADQLTLAAALGRECKEHDSDA